MSPDTPDTQVSLAKIVAGELAAAEKKRGEFISQQDPQNLQNAILVLSILINLLFFLTRSDYIVMFIAASFYLNMFYFITLLVPTNPGIPGWRRPEIAKFHTWLIENGITSSTRQFTRIFINTFFMNCRALTFAISLLFAVDIIFTLLIWLDGFPSTIALFVIVQSAVIITFYSLVWKTEPFTTEFAKNIDLVRTRLSHELPPVIISLLFFTGFLTVVFLFLTTIILLPGVTLNAFLTESRLSELAHMFLLLSILAISQYFIIRSLHGKTSRVMALRLMDYREQLLQSLVRDIGNTATSGPAAGVEGRYEMTSRLMESRIYRIKRNSLLGTFPVFVMDLDFSVMLDTTTLTAIKGYISRTDK